MAEQFQGKYTKLDPVISVDSVEYSGAVVFNQNPEKPTANAQVVAGIVTSVSDGGGENKDIVCKRDFQSDSYFVSRADGGPYEVGFQVYTGGNIVDAYETQRLPNYSNSGAIRGGDYRTKAQVGDVLRWEGKSFLIVGAEPFAVAPAEVDYTGGENFPIVSYHNLDFQSVLFQNYQDANNPYASVYFVPASTGPFQECNLYVFNGTTYIPLTQKIFSFKGSADEDYLPPSASFGSNEYWYDRVNYQFRLASNIALTGNDFVGAFYYRDVQLVTEASESIKVVESVGDGYADSDSLTVWGRITTEDFSIAPFVYTYDGHNGTGSLEWRKTGTPDSQGVFMEWDETRNVVGVYKRNADGASLTVLSHTPTSFSGANFVTFYLDKVGDAFTFSYSDDTHSKTTIATTTLSGVVQNTSGIVSVGNWNATYPVKFVGLGAAGIPQYRGNFGSGVNGVVSMQSSLAFTGVSNFASVTLPSPNDVEEVYNVTAGAAMSESLSATRSSYQKSGNVLSFYSESCYDRIRVTQTANVGNPTPPGFAPLIPYTENLATRQEGSKVATTNLNQNILNWSDSLVIHDPNDEFQATAGEAFTIHRNPIFSSEEPPALYFDVYNDEMSDWTAMAEEDYLPRWVDGVILIAKSFIDSHAGEELCFRVDGKRFRQAGNCKARQFTELAKALEAFDQTWVSIPVGGPAEVLYGWMPGTHIHQSYTSCDTLADDDDLAVQTARETAISADFYRNHYNITEFPAWRDTNSLLIESHATSFFANTESDFVNCGSVYNTGPLVDAGYVFLQRNQIITENFYRGSDTLGFNFFDNKYPAFGEFAFGGQGIALPDIVKRLPNGSTCVAAYVPVRFDGLRIKNYSGTYMASNHTTNLFWMVQGQPEPEYEYAQMLVNGEVLYQIETGETSIYGSPDWDTSGSIGLTLIGRRRKSNNIYLPHTDSYAAIPDGDWVAVGGGLVVGGEVADGKWGLVDVTNIVNALINARDTELSDFQLWYGRAGVDPGDSATDMRSFLKTLVPTQSYSSSAPSSSSGGSLTFTTSFQEVRWNSVEFGSIMARFSLPSSTPQTKAFPLIHPPLVEIDE